MPVLPTPLHVQQEMQEFPHTPRYSLAAVATHSTVELRTSAVQEWPPAGIFPKPTTPVKAKAALLLCPGLAAPVSCSQPRQAHRDRAWPSTEISTSLCPPLKLKSLFP